MAFGKDVGIYITYEGKVYQIPVNPEKLTVKYSGNNKVEESIGLGDINILKRRKLTDISFKSFFPGSVQSFPGVRTAGAFLTPAHYKVLFDKMMKYSKFCKLTISGLSVAINLNVSVEDFEYDVNAGEHEDLYYTLTLKEYVEYNIKEIPVNDAYKRYTNGSTGNSTGNKASTPSNITLKPTSITKGCTVMLNGTVCYDSNGSRPGKTFKNYKCKVNLINKKGTHPYHVTTLSGGWLGWVKKSEVVIV